MNRRDLLGLAASLGLSACATPIRLPAVPRERTLDAAIPGMANVRFYADTQDAAMVRRIIEADARERAALPPRAIPPAIDVLAISGGGENGAYGAGVLTEWSRQGTRPTFRLVTGVSTGALTAPFAFLGPARDAQLEEVYVGLTPDKIFIQRGMLAAVFDDALTDNAPLFATISRLLDENMMAEIAAEYARDRFLLIGTTDLDARRGVIWNIGAIASSGAPGALDLIRRVLLASAAIPGVFPPVLVDVEIDGLKRQELHVDGGALAQMFVFPYGIQVAARAAGFQRRAVRVWAMRNGRLDPEWGETDRRVLSIAGAAVSTMIHASGTNDVERIWRRAGREGWGFRLAYIRPDFEVALKSPFEPTYMRALFDYGAAQMRAGQAWAAAPPWAEEVREPAAPLPPQPSRPARRG